jgi:uncharacterized protein YjbJ (UPF0337 family)
MSLQKRAKAAAQNIEGKIEEAIGNITHDSSKQAEGQAKQVEANIRNASEDAKDKAVDVANIVKEKAKDVANIVKEKAKDVAESVEKKAKDVKNSIN